MATGRSSGYRGLSAEFSNYVLSVGFPSERDKKEALLLLICLDTTEAGSARCNDGGTLAGGASTFTLHGSTSSDAADGPGYPATLALPIWPSLSFLPCCSVQHNCCHSSCTSFSLLHRHRPTSQPFQSTTSILPPLTALSKAVR